MKITKYGIADQYGFGVVCNGSRLVFATNIKIIAKSCKNTDTSKTISKSGCHESIMIKPYNGPYRTFPLFLVQEEGNGIWKEYYTGMTIGATKKALSILHQFYFDVDTMCFNSDPDYPAKSCCHKRITAFNTKEVNPELFAELKAKWTKVEIKEFVSRLYEMAEDAKQWGIAFDETVNQVLNERSQKEKGFASISSTLESGFGQYASQRPEPEHKQQPQMNHKDKSKDPQSSRNNEPRISAKDTKSPESSPKPAFQICIGTHSDNKPTPTPQVFYSRPASQQIQPLQSTQTHNMNNDPIIRCPSCGVIEIKKNIFGREYCPNCGWKR